MKCRFNEIKRKLFAYGTLKKGHKNAFYLNSSRKIDDGYIEGFVMYGLEKQIPFIIKSEDKKKQIFGEIYEVSESIWNQIRGLESDYVSTKVEVITNGLSHECFVYIMENKEIIDKWINELNFKEIESGIWEKNKNRFDYDAITRNYDAITRSMEGLTSTAVPMDEYEEEEEEEEDDGDY